MCSCTPVARGELRPGDVMIVQEAQCGLCVVYIHNMCFREKVLGEAKSEGEARENLHTEVVGFDHEFGDLGVKFIWEGRVRGP